MPPQPSTTKKNRQSLLIPSKRRLLASSSTKPLNPSSKPAHISIKLHNLSPSSQEATSAERQEPVTLEVDLSNAPQPFLDPVAWSNMKAVAESRAGEGVQGAGSMESERETEKEAEREFGGMAVRSRRNVRRRERGRGR